MAPPLLVVRAWDRGAWSARRSRAPLLPPLRSGTPQYPRSHALRSTLHAPRPPSRPELVAADGRDDPGDGQDGQDAGDAAGDDRERGAEEGSDRARLELAELRPALHEDLVGRGDPAAQRVGREELEDLVAQGHADRVGQP